jgi:hypothetical protein
VAQRWNVLNSLFERIELKDGRIMGFKPRADRVGRVRLLIDTAIAFSGMTRSLAELKAMLTTDSGSGKGGIRTLEGALHPLPA